MPKKRKRPDTVDEWWGTIHDNNKSLDTHCADVIDTWSRRVQVAAGSGALLAKKFKAVNQSTMVQIESQLADSTRLIRRTQLLRVPLKVVGKPFQDPKQSQEGEEDTEQDQTEQYDEEIFDDTDFYQDLLKDLIEEGLLLNEGDIGSMHYRKQLKNMKRKTMKRLSNEKKTRYEVKKELLGFMAPKHETASFCPWNLEDLYHSLFGRAGLPDRPN